MSAQPDAPVALHLLSLVYGRVAAWRRRWHRRHPEAQRRLSRPVISVGNLSVGGSGKTPVVAALATLLLASGERPSILTRGYARKQASDGVLVVSDTERVLASVERSGDEPQMLARALRGVPVLVSRDRHLAGELAEHQFDCTVHILDDGFQHLELARDIDLLVLPPDDLEGRVLPAGRLRESASAAMAADAWLVPGPADDVATHPRPAFRIRIAPAPPRRVHPFGAPADIDPTRAIAVAGIARPQRFFSTARACGWDIEDEMVYRDHLWFTAKDVEAMVAAASRAGASVVVTTEKDAVRLEPLIAARAGAGPAFLFIPIEATIEPADTFGAWLRQRLTRSDRTGRTGGSRGPA